MESGKADLRRQMREIAAGLTEEYVRKSGRAIYENFVSLAEYENAGVIFTYFSTGREPDTVDIIKKALADGKTVAIPFILGGGVMEARRIWRADGLARDRFGIPAPSDGAETIPQEGIDLVIVPGLSFDREFYRLGRGGGYYDRYLAGTAAFKVGLVRETETADALPRTWNDVPVDCVITETGIKKREAPKGPAV